MNITNNHGRDSGSRLGLVGRSVGVLAMLAGLLGAGYLFVISVLPYLFVDGEWLAEANAPISLFWSIVIVVLSLGAGYWTWTEKLLSVWVLVVVMSIFTVLGLFTIGRLTAPFAVLLLVAAVLLTAERHAERT